MVKIVLSFVLCFLPAFSFIFAIAGERTSLDERYEVFFRANAAYRDGYYEKAALIYEKLIRGGTVGGGIFYNLGNSYVRMNRLGKGVLNYERAKRLMPRDPDLDFNLRYARDRVKDRTEGPSSPSAFRWLHSFSTSEVFWSFVTINLFFWSFLILHLWGPSEWRFYMLIGCGLLWVLLGVSAGMKWYQETHDLSGVVIAPEIAIHAGPDERDTVLFTLHAGTVVICEREEEDWRLVQLTPERRGWALAEFIERVAMTYIGGSPCKDISR